MFGWLRFEDFAFIRMSSGEIGERKDLASIHRMLQERAPDYDARGMSSTYENWVELVVSSSLPSIAVPPSINMARTLRSTNQASRKRPRPGLLEGYEEESNTLECRVSLVQSPWGGCLMGIVSIKCTIRYLDKE